MNTELILKLVKSRLNRLPIDTIIDEYLLARIDAAIQELQRNGIDLVDDIDDAMLVCDTVVWQYQNRDNNNGMPDWLRLKRRERWITSKSGV